MSKTRQDKSALPPELDQARSKLDGVLQNLMEKTEESQSSSSQSDEESKPSQDVIMKDPSPISSPSKRVQKSQRKRRRKDEVAVQSSNTYITKIYGCSVDLAQFDENSPLYAMCRSWIQNKPVQQSEKSSMDEEEEDRKPAEEGREKRSDDHLEGIHSLPPPTPPPRGKDDKVRDLRIPTPVPQPSEKFFMASDESEVIPANVLLASHQARWKITRQRWKEAAMANEERFKESTSILLKAMSQDEAAPWEGVQA